MWSCGKRGRSPFFQGLWEGPKELSIGRQIGATFPIAALWAKAVSPQCNNEERGTNDELEEAGYGEYLQAFIDSGVVKKPEAGAVKKPSTAGVAVVAAGCFWGVEHLFKHLEGVRSTEVGYTGGIAVNPSYHEVCTGGTGHAEAVRIEFDPAVVSYAEVLRFFFRLHDPTTLNRQHNDVGTQYRSAIFAATPEQRRVAEQIVREENESGRFRNPVVTEVADLETFWSAEEDHQNYLDNNPNGYNCHILRD